jgi:hypothetical protein
MKRIRFILTFVAFCGFVSLCSGENGAVLDSGDVAERTIGAEGIKDSLKAAKPAYSPAIALTS